jgi:hypothetical protein
MMVPYKYAQACIAAQHLQHWWRTPVKERHEFEDGREVTIEHNRVQAGDTFVLGLNRRCRATWTPGQRRYDRGMWYAQSGIVTHVVHVVGDGVHPMDAWEYHIAGDIGGYPDRLTHGRFFYWPAWDDAAAAQIEADAKAGKWGVRVKPTRYLPTYAMRFVPTMQQLLELSGLSFQQAACHAEVAWSRGMRDDYPNAVALRTLLTIADQRLAAQGVPVDRDAYHGRRAEHVELLPAEHIARRAVSRAYAQLFGGWVDPTPEHLRKRQRSTCAHAEGVELEDGSVHPDMDPDFD